MSASANQVAPGATNRQLMRVDETGFDLFPGSKELVLTNVNANQPNCFRTVSLWIPLFLEFWREHWLCLSTPSDWMDGTVARIKREARRWRGKLIFPQLDSSEIERIARVGTRWGNLGIEINKWMNRNQRWIFGD